MQESNPEARQFGMLCHLLAFAGFVFPLGFILGPLVIWLMKKDQYPFVDQQGKSSVNFQISIFIYMVISAIIGVITCGIGFIITAGIAIFQIIMVIQAAVKANNGESFEYPMSIRFLN